MRKISIILGVLVVCAVVLTALPYQKRAKTLHVRLGGEALLLEVADTDTLRAKGLSGHAPLKDGEGMFFVFEQKGMYGFWMKDMSFSIDIVWLDQNYGIIDVKERVRPSSYPEVFVPRAPAQYVVELREGFFTEHHLQVGNILEIL